MQMEKDLVTLISRGYKMEAIKMLRLYYSVDLMTAKKMVDDWESARQNKLIQDNAMQLTH